MPLYHHKAEVTFKGQFPIDMLRYDRACPQSEEDSTMIQLSGSYRGIGPGGAATVKVCKITDQKKPQWTEGRWKSFGCRIEHIETVRRT